MLKSKLKSKPRKKDGKALKTTLLVVGGAAIGGSIVLYRVVKLAAKEVLKWYDERG